MDGQVASKEFNIVAMVVDMYMYLQQLLSIKGYCGEVYQMNLMLSPTIEFSQLCRNGFTDFADFTSYFSKIVW